MKLVITSFIILCFSLSHAQTINRNWSSELHEEINQFKSCENTSNIGVNSCNAFIGQTLKTIYRVNDFYTSTKGRYMLVSEIQDYLQSDNRWTLLGKGYDQEVLAKAQKLANENKAVVAVYINKSNIGHLAYILPGELQSSGSWGVRVPNSAAFFTTQPEKSYLNKGLSYSFPRTAITEVHLYARKY
ncbi:MAG: hypothetical protein RIG62_02945 [Cyclobacteriaceae bacterium]